MTVSLDRDAPVVVGALGGSGTRVVGDILRGAGVHIGGNLNTANDSVTATVLFNRPEWAATATPEEIAATFVRLRRFLLQQDVTAGDYAALVTAALRPGHTEGVRRRLRYARRVRRERGPGKATLWGWKEPNSHLFLTALSDIFPGLRFVYVMRHPLDMAFSTNLNQLRNWAPRFDVSLLDPADADAVARAQLDLWLAATRRATENGARGLGKRFATLRFDDLVDDPRASVDRLIDHVGADADEAQRQALATLPKRPDSDGRYRSRELTVFGDERLAAAESLWGEL